MTPIRTSRAYVAPLQAGRRNGERRAFLIARLDLRPVQPNVAPGSPD